MKARLPAAASAALLIALALAGCNDKAKEGDDRTASGQVLEGTISDAMLPLDTATSRPPLLKTVPKAPDAQASDESGEGEDATADPGETAAPAPQPAPTSEATD